MSNDLIKILLGAEIGKDSIQNIKSQIDGVQKSVAPIKILIDTNTAVANVKDLTALLKQVEKQSKPIEVAVVTDKAEIAMQNFAKSMGVKLDKNLREQFSNLASNVDMKQFEHLAERIGQAYSKAMDKHSKQLSMNMLGGTDDAKIYEYINGQVLKLDESTVNAKNNVDGFGGAIRNLMTQSKDAGLSLDQLNQALVSEGLVKAEMNTEDFAEHLTKVIQRVREAKDGFVEFDNVADRELFVNQELLKLLGTLDGIQKETKRTVDSLEKVDSVGDNVKNVDIAFEGVEAQVKSLGIVNRKTFEDMNNDVYKYIDTYKNLEKGITISDTYTKNNAGGFDFSGRVIDNKSVEIDYKAMEKAHGEALKMNKAMDDLAIKNRQMAKDAAWKQYFQGITETSKEIQQLNQYYSQLADGGMEKAHEQAIKLNNEFDKLEQVTKKNLSLDVDKMSKRYKGLVSSDDLASVNSMIDALKFDDPNMGKNIDLIKIKMKEVSNGAESSRKSLDLANKSSMSFGEAMKTAAYKFGIWGAITASYYKLLREISEGLKFVNDMDSKLTEIGIVLGQNREQVSGLAQEYNNLAKEMHVTTTEVASAAVEFYRQGLSQTETMERLRVTTMYSKIANLEFAQSAELLTATVNSMGIDIERAADVFTYLGDATATGADEIGIGFSKTSGAAAALGVEFEKVASWIKCSPSM